MGFRGLKKRMSVCVHEALHHDGKWVGWDQMKCGLLHRKQRPVMDLGPLTAISPNE